MFDQIPKVRSMVEKEAIALTLTTMKSLICRVNRIQEQFWERSHKMFRSGVILNHGKQPSSLKQ